MKLDPNIQNANGLVLTRRVGEVIVIDHGKIMIQVASIAGKQAQIKVICDKSIKVDRLEKIIADVGV